MLPGKTGTESRSFTLLLAVMAAAFVICMLAFPDEVFQASMRGLKLWWEVVFPALLPFMILSGMLIGFGFVQGLGALLDPLMRACFRIPGEGGWAAAMGLTGGYPLGAEVTTRLLNAGRLQPSEAQRLLGVSHLANPMLPIGIIGAGFLHSPQAGAALAVIHYGCAIATGVLLRGRAPRGGPNGSGSGEPMGQGHLLQEHAESLWVKAGRRMAEARASDGRTFGKLLGDSVTTSIQNLFLLGGFMMFFSVAVRICLLLTSQTSFAAILDAHLPGFLEAHLGAFVYSDRWSHTSAWLGACLAAGLSWSGLSAHAQAMGASSGSGLRYGPFLKFRLVHASLSFAAGWFLWQPLLRKLDSAQAVLTFAPAGVLAPSGSSDIHLWSSGSAFSLWTSLLLLLLLLLSAMTVVSFCIHTLGKSRWKR